MSTQQLEQTYELAVYPRRDIVLVRGSGTKLFDENDREYIDCAANVGVSNIGHGNQTVARAVHAGIPVPAYASALAFYDGFRSERLPANLIQAQRDSFGAHTYERVDKPRGDFFHSDWGQ